MKCHRCFAELPRQAQFCLRCGSPVESGTSGTTTGGLPAPRPNNKPLLIVIGLLLLAVTAMGAWVWKAQGDLAQKAGTSAPTTGLVQAPGQSSTSPLVQAPGEAPPPAPMVQQPGETNPAPADVIDYLNFVRQCEATKQRIIHDTDRDLKAMIATLPADQLKQMLAGADDSSGASDAGMASKIPTEAAKISDETQKQFDELTRVFQAKQPPASCLDLRNKFYTHLGRLEGRLLEVLGLLKKIGSDPESLLKEAQDMQGKSADLDNDAKVANEAKNDICSTFHLQSTFDIKGDDSQQSLVGGL